MTGRTGDVTPIPKPAKRRKASGFSKTILARDPYCRRCGKRSNHAHHVVKRGQGGDDVAENGMGLCWYCHDLVEARKVPVKPMLRPEEAEYVKSKGWWERLW